MAQNLQSLEFLFAIDPEKKFTFFSNGYFDYSVRAFLTQNTKQVETIIISIDGLECTHNRRRPLGRENGFARILSNLHFLREKKIPFAIQINVDSNNSDEIVRLVQYLPIYADTRGTFTYPVATEGINVPFQHNFSNFLSETCTTTENFLKLSTGD